MLFLLLLILVLVLRHRRRKVLVEEAEPAQEPVIFPEKKSVDIMAPNLMRTMDLRKDVRKFADDNPEMAAQMLRNWLREGDEKNE